MKKTAVFMAAILFILSVMTGIGTAAYTPVTPENTTISHTLELTDSPYFLDYTFTYSFQATDPKVFIPDGLAPSDVISGNPTISSISYGPDDDFATPTDHKVTKNPVVNWSGVQFKEPGIFYWKVTKTKDAGGAPEELSNNNDTTYLFAYVIDVDGKLQVAVTDLCASNNKNFNDKIDIDDQYPATHNDLSVGKTVTGNQGSKDQYFKFVISITPAGQATRTYPISGFDTADTVNASPYNDGATQPTSPVSLTGGQNKEITVWLKHGQTFKIEGLPYNSSYTITETATGYETTYVVTGDNTNEADNDNASGSGTSVSDKSITNDTVVQFTNNREVTPPTGIDLESGAPVMGLILAVVLMVLVFAPKRREENN